MKIKSGFLRVGVIFALATAICLSSQAAQPGSADNGRLIVKRSRTVGNDVVLRLSIDGEVHNITPNSLYDQPIPAGKHSLKLETVGNQSQSTSTSVEVEPGHTYSFTAARGSDQGVSLVRS